MAEGLNKQLRRNVQNFVRDHQIMVNPNAFLPAQQIPSPNANIDLVHFDPHHRNLVRLENYDQRPHGRGAAPIVSYYLPAVVDNTSTIPIGGARNYMFTPDLSGCLFAAYGANNQNLTVEHVNVRTGAAAVPIVPRATAIINAGHAYYRILSPVPIPGSNPAYVKTYNANSCVVGHNPGGGWIFYYKTTINNVLQL